MGLILLALEETKKISRFHHRGGGGIGSNTSLQMFFLIDKKVSISLEGLGLGVVLGLSRILNSDFFVAL